MLKGITGNYLVRPAILNKGSAASTSLTNALQLKKKNTNHVSTMNLYGDASKSYTQRNARNTKPRGTVGFFSFMGHGRYYTVCDSLRRLKNAIGTKERFGFALWRHTHTSARVKILKRSTAPHNFPPCRCIFPHWTQNAERNKRKRQSENYNVGWLK